jgi:hypothetical protein
MVRDGKKKRSNAEEKAESAEPLPSAAAAAKVPTKGRLSTSTTRDSRGDDADNNKVTHRSRTAAKSVFTVDEKPSKPKPASTRPAISNPYLAGVDLPPSESDSDDDDDEAAERRRSRATVDLKAAALSKKDALRKERREAEAAARA